MGILRKILNIAPHYFILPKNGELVKTMVLDEWEYYELLRRGLLEPKKKESQDKEGENV